MSVARARASDNMPRMATKQPAANKATKKIAKEKTAAKEPAKKPKVDPLREPTLRVLTLTVAADVPLAGLLDLKQLNYLTLQAGARPLDEATAATIAALAREKSRELRPYEHEGWPLQLALAKRVSPGCVDIN